MKKENKYVTYVYITFLLIREHDLNAFETIKNLFLFVT